MTDLSVRLGSDARTAMCGAFDSAQTSIDAEFYSIDDRAVVDSLNRASRRGIAVTVVVEGDPHRYARKHELEPSDESLRSIFDEPIHVVVSHDPKPLVHAKAAVIDRMSAFIATANVKASGFWSAGEVLVLDANAADARAVETKIEDAARGRAGETGEAQSRLRIAIDALLGSPADVRLASEDLSDEEVGSALARRARAGHHDHVLVGRSESRSSKVLLRKLIADGVDVRALPSGLMHEKYVDCGDRIYVGSANLTRNGLDEASEIGIVADAEEFGAGARAIRNSFDAMWKSASPINFAD